MPAKKMPAKQVETARERSRRAWNAMVAREAKAAARKKSTKR